MLDNKEKLAVERVMKSGVLSGYRGSFAEEGKYFYGGEEVKALESEWAKKFGVKHAIAVNSATSGLWCAVMATKGKTMAGEVIVTPYSMTCSASIPLVCGMRPMFADIEPDYFCIDPKEVIKKITSRTVAIIAVDLFGMPYSKELDDVSKKYNIPIIEDAAQAIGAKRDGKYAGTLGNIGVYSLNVHKHIQAGEGGVMVTDDDRTAFKLRLLINHAEAVNNDLNNGGYINLVGMNLRMTELTAAIAREQLKKLDKIIDGYQSNAVDFEIPIRKGCTSAYYKYASLGMPVNPDKDKYNMKDHYITPLYRLPLFRSLGYNQSQCPVCETVDKNIKLAWLKKPL